MRGMRLQVYAQIRADLYFTAHGENPLYEVSGMRKAQLAEESDDIRKRCGGGITDAHDLQFDGDYIHPVRMT